MSKRVKSDGDGHVGPADAKTEIFYDVTVICGCGKYASVLLNKSKIPEALYSLMCSVRWDDPKLPIAETGRPLNEDTEDMKNKLLLQTLIQPHKGCTKASWLDTVNFDPGCKKKEGFLLGLDESNPKSSIKEVVAQTPALLTGHVALIRQNTMVNRCHFVVFDSWKEEVTFEA